MKRKHGKQVRVAMTVALASISIAYYTGSLFAQSDEDHSIDIDNEEVREENTEMVSYDGVEVEKEFTITRASSTITINDDLNKVYDGKAVVAPTNVVTTGSTGAVRFEWYTAEGTKLVAAPVNAGNYKVKAILAGDGNYEGAEVEKSFTISKAITKIIINGDLNKVYNGLPAVAPSITTIGSAEGVTIEWYTAEGTKLPAAPTNAGSYKIKALIGGNINFDSAEVEKAFVIAKANSTMTINDDLNKIYDEQAVVAPIDIVTTGSTGAVSLEWYTADSTKLQEAPVNVGSYKVKAILAEDINHVGTEVEKAFEITKATNQWKQELIIQDWIYGEIANIPSAEAQFGIVEFTYSTAEDGVYTTEIPSNAGTYWVKAAVTETNNYEGLEGKKSFTIGMASSNIMIDNDLDKLFDGTAVENPQVTVTGSTGTITCEWYRKEENIAGVVTWTKLATAPSEVGEYKVVVTVAGDENYTEATVGKEFLILENIIVVPTPETGGIITNPSGGTITIIPEDIIESNGPVIINPDGSTTFPNGGIVTKLDGSVVIIQPGATLKPNNLPVESEGTTTISGQEVTGVQTGDRTQVGLWTMLVGLSTGIMMFFRGKNRKEGV